MKTLAVALILLSCSISAWAGYPESIASALPQTTRPAFLPKQWGCVGSDVGITDASSENRKIVDRVVLISPMPPAGLGSLEPIDALNTGAPHPIITVRPTCQKNLFTTKKLAPYDPSPPANMEAGKIRLGWTRPSQPPDLNERPSGEVEWPSLGRQSINFLGVMHAFRIATEPSTRNALKNPAVGGYFRALGSMHGWSDGDGYYENYLGHPIEGAVAGYIWIHNDPRYRNVEFGSSRDYWMSRLRAYAFAWAFSEQFEIGPLSEASVGQIQRYCCAYGFVDHVITPNAGLVWLVGGDILDKYVVRRIEDHTRNLTVRALARGILNPPLTFANVMAGQAPWHRENRPGIRKYDGELYIQSATRHPRQAHAIPSFELTATLPGVLRLDRLSCLGGGAVGAFQVTDSWQWTAEVSGCSLGNFASHWSGDSLTFSTGPQWISHSSGRWSPHLAVRLGGHKVTQEYVDPALRKAILGSLPPGTNPNTVREEYAKHCETTGLSLSISGGADLRLHRALALRIANVEYIRSWLNPLNGYDFTRSYRVSSGLVLRVGTW